MSATQTPRKPWRINTLGQKPNHRHEDSTWGESRLAEPDDWKPSDGYIDSVSWIWLMVRVVAMAAVIALAAMALGVWL